MNETIMDGGPATTVTADQGDVPSSVLGIGYEPEVLAREEEDEELSAAEEALGLSDESALDGMPGEAPGPPAAATPTYSADQGDVPSTAIGVGYDAATLDRAEEWEQLSEAEAAGSSLPGEATSPAPAIQPPAGLSGWFKREPLLAALVVANAPILATLVTSITQDNQTLSILAGSAAVVLNTVVGAARNAVTPTASPKLAELTPLVPARGG
ncbi:MAG TPA: hypothetical protein VF066_18275 [Thermoleophilaceae bacterium]